MKHSPMLGRLGLLIVDEDQKLLRFLVEELSGAGHPYIDCGKEQEDSAGN